MFGLLSTSLLLLFRGIFNFSVFSSTYLPSLFCLPSSFISGMGIIYLQWSLFTIHFSTSLISQRLFEVIINTSNKRFDDVLQINPSNYIPSGDFSPHTFPPRPFLLSSAKKIPVPSLPSVPSPPPPYCIARVSVFG